MSARNVTCDGCGGALVADGRPVAPAPASASGCGCAVRAAVASQRAAVERVARAGRLPADAIARIAGGVYDVPRDALPPRGALLCGCSYDNARRCPHDGGRTRDDNDNAVLDRETETMR